MKSSGSPYWRISGHEPIPGKLIHTNLLDMDDFARNPARDREIETSEKYLDEFSRIFQ